MGEPPLHFSQARRIIDKFATPGKSGPAAISEGTGISREQIYRWDYSVERGGTGGRVPSRSLQKVLAWARTIGVTFTPEELDPRGLTL